MNAQADKHPHATEFEVDGEPIETTEKTLTANQIMGLAGVDPTSHYLVELHGREQDSYQGRAEEPIHIHEKEKFITVSTGPTPVS
jgi:hypothetical protein